MSLKLHECVREKDSERGRETDIQILIREVMWHGHGVCIV